MFGNEFKLDDDTFEISDTDKKVKHCEIKENFSKVNENLNEVGSFFDEIDGFMDKQIELFSTLNAKFPNISQFSIALNEAKDLNLNIQKNRSLLLSLSEKLENIENNVKQKMKKKQTENEIIKILLELSLHVENLSENEEVLEELKNIASKSEQ